MAKGNHVFNAFDKVIIGIYQGILEQLDPGAAKDFKAVRGSGGDITQAEKNLSGRFPNSYKYLTEIRKHANIALIHTTQDDRDVVANDANSKAFGDESERFNAVVMKWATGASNEDAMVVWRQLINTGADPLAQQTYVTQGSSAVDTPNSPDARRKRCVDLEGFIRGGLTTLVRNWLLGIRLDLKNLKLVKYEPKDSADWGVLLSRK